MTERNIHPSGPTFEDDAALAATAGIVGLGREFTDLLRDTARHVNRDTDLRAAAQQARRVVFDTDVDPSAAAQRLDAVAGPLADRVHLLFVLEVARLVVQRQGRRGIPEAITRSVIDSQPGRWLRQAERELVGPTRVSPDGGTSREPAREWDPAWSRLVARGELFRLGRLEFVPMDWRHPFVWFRHRERGGRLLVAADGVPLTIDGYLTGELTWTTEYRQDGESVVAHPVHPGGRVLREPVRLPTAEWEQTLGPGDPVLDLHVPADGRLELPVLRDSLEQAVAFFDRWYPDRRFVAFHCASWLFSPQLPRILGGSSTIVRWQREGYLFPDRAASVLRWVFGTRTVDPSTAPRDNRLRAGLLDLVAAGETLRTGRWLLARDDLPRFGEQPYRHVADAIRRAQ